MFVGLATMAIWVDTRTQVKVEYHKKSRNKYTKLSCKQLIKRELNQVNFMDCELRQFIVYGWMKRCQSNVSVWRILFTQIWKNFYICCLLNMTGLLYMLFVKTCTILTSWDTFHFDDIYPAHSVHTRWDHGELGASFLSVSLQLSRWAHCYHCMVSHQKISRISHSKLTVWVWSFLFFSVANDKHIQAN